MLFSASFIWLSRLLIDKLIEGGYFGKNWEVLFLEEINSLATWVLYDPASIDYSVKPGTQEAFEMLLTAQVKAVVKSHIMDWHYSSKQKIQRNDDFNEQHPSSRYGSLPTNLRWLPYPGINPMNGVGGEIRCWYWTATFRPGCHKRRSRHG